MSHVSAAPELMHSAATELAAIGANLNAAHLTAAGPTVGLIPAAADEVSESVAQLFSGEAQEYQKLAGQAASFHDEFVQHLKAGAVAYSSAEDVNVSLLSQPSAAATASLTRDVNAVFWPAFYYLYNGFSDLLYTISPPLQYIFRELFSALYTGIAFLIVAGARLILPNSPI